MKLLIVLSIIAYGYADKLDRAYLPPVNAATAGGSPGALLAPGASSASRQPSSNLGQAGEVDFGQGLPAGRQPETGSGQSRPYTFGGVSGSAPNGPGFGTKITQGPSGNNQFSSGTGSNTPTGGIGNVPLLGANAPFGTSGQTSGSTYQPGANTFNVGSQQTYKPQSESPSSQGFGQGTQQAFNGAQAYKPERAQAAADRNAEILKYVNENNGESYLYSYETSNGISAEESGVATNGVKAQGGFSYTGDDGQAYSLTYTADENGFQPQGEHLPTPHPIPEEILKSIEENSRAAAAGTQEGAYRPEEYESEDSSQQYNIEQTSFNRPQGQSQVSTQESFSQGPATQAQSNKYSGNQDSSIPNRITGQSGQFGQIRPGQSSNQFGAGPSGAQGQIDQYQQGSGNNQGLAGQFPGQYGQISKVTPSLGSSQFGTGAQSGQSNQYQTGFGSNQGPFGQTSSPGSNSPGVGQNSQGQGSSGYNYNQPQNAFGSATQFGSGVSVQNQPQANQGQITSTSGSQNGQGTYGLQSGKLPLSEKPFGTAQGSQFGQSQNSLNRPGNQPTGSAGIFGQQNQLNANKPLFASSQGSQVRPGSQGSSGSTGSSGYQYQTNVNRPFELNRPSGSSFQPSQGSQYQPNANKPSGAINGIKGSTQFGAEQQNQLNANKPSFASSQGSQVRPGSQESSGPIGSSGSTGSFGYQYQTNVNRPSFGLNGASGSSFQLNQGSQYQPNAKPSGATNGIKGSTQFGASNTGPIGQTGQGQQYQQNGNRPFGVNTVNQGSSPFGGPSGTKKTGSGSLFGQANQAFGSNVGPSQSASTQFGLGSPQSTPAQGPSGPKGSAPVQAPYQYNRPSQSFPTQQQPGKGFSGNQDLSGQRPGGSSFGSQSFNGQKPGVISQGPQGSFGQRPGSAPGSQDVNGANFNSQESQGINGRPGLSGSQGVNGQRPGGSFSGPQGVNSKRPAGSFPGSQGVIGQRPGVSSSEAQGVNGQRPGTSGSGGPSQSNQGRPEQFGGPRQPPSFNPQEGYKY